MLLFKFAIIIIGLCATIKARKRNNVKIVNDFSTERKDKTSVVIIVFRLR